MKAMAVMTISEARAALPGVLDRVANGEEITITRHGRPAAVVVRPDVVWHRPGSVAETAVLVALLRERAHRHGRSLRQEVMEILETADEEPRPPIGLHTVRTSAASTWSRAEIYGDEGR